MKPLPPLNAQPSSTGLRIADLTVIESLLFLPGRWAYLLLTSKVLESATSVTQGEFQNSGPTSGESSLAPLCLLCPTTFTRRQLPGRFKVSQYLTVRACLPPRRTTAQCQVEPPPLSAYFCPPHHHRFSKVQRSLKEAQDAKLQCPDSSTSKGPQTTKVSPKSLYLLIQLPTQFPTERFRECPCGVVLGR